MKKLSTKIKALAAAGSLVTIWALGAASPAQAAFPDTCPAPHPSIVRFDNPLRQISDKLRKKEPVTILAIGSSSTAGALTSDPQTMAFPARLGALLREQTNNENITVVNKGKNGIDIDYIFEKFDELVADVKPDLILLQMGTNTVIKGQSVTDAYTKLRRVLDRINAMNDKGLQTKENFNRPDVILIDPQYAPVYDGKGLIAKDMINLTQMAARIMGVSVFRRHDLMEQWVVKNKISMNDFLVGDGLHMNDKGHECVAEGLAQAIFPAQKRIGEFPVATSPKMPTPPLTPKVAEPNAQEQSQIQPPIVATPKSLRLPSRARLTPDTKFTLEHII